MNLGMLSLALGLLIGGLLRLMGQPVSEAFITIWLIITGGALLFGVAWPYVRGSSA